MDYSQVIEPAFRIVAMPDGKSAASVENDSFSLARMAESVRKKGFSLLERMGLCHAPHILSAQCFAEEFPGTGR